jgi:hypothetical protein
MDKPRSLSKLSQIGDLMGGRPSPYALDITSSVIEQQDDERLFEIESAIDSEILDLSSCNSFSGRGVSATLETQHINISNEGLQAVIVYWNSKI